MKALNVKNMRKAKQQGFTIIELVVVILLLGILTATALPRFMDVTDEAHDAVVDAVRGGLLTSAALFRAQYVGKGEPLGVALADFGDDTLFPDGNGTGYPADATDGELNDETECLAVYNGLLQVGRPLAAAEAPLDGCVLYYVGQFKSGNTTASQIIPNLVYTLASGAVVDGTPLTLNLAD